MKLLFICHDYFISGANKSLLDLLEDNSNNKITVIIPKENKVFKSKLEKLGCNVIVFRHILCIKSLRKGLLTTIKNMVRKIYFYLFFKFRVSVICKKLDKDFDFIISNSFSEIFGYYISQKLSIPHVFYIREFMEDDHKISHIDKNIGKICSDSYAIFISKSIETFYLSKYKFIKYFQIYDKIKNDSIKLSNKKNDVFSICIVGSLIEGKGHSDIIYAINELRKRDLNVILHIAGEGPLNSKLRQIVKELNLFNVTFCGHISNIFNFISEHDLLISCSYKEALGRVMVEAMYSKIGVIGTRSGEAPILLDSGRGFLYNSGDYNELATLISDVMTNKVEFDLEKSYEYAIENFSGNKLNKIVNKLKEWENACD